MKRIVKFGKRKFICELKTVLVSGGKNTTKKVFCKEIKTKQQKLKEKLSKQPKI